MSCCSAKTIEDKLQPYELRSMYICQIRRLCKKGVFGEAINVFREVNLHFFLCLFVFIAADFFVISKVSEFFFIDFVLKLLVFFQIVERLTKFTRAGFVCSLFLWTYNFLLFCICCNNILLMDNLVTYDTLDGTQWRLLPFVLNLVILKLS